ncbi:hypothetical protein HII31_05897 [Pseudocercospora fuligena]|uniref:Calcineurin-like phosphoesterase domain-containing protein n=1 Tax=Pseudocercospora fuligena TaxID=685502 RepID=A0A8H6RMD5_9PEZI|nr:hypothetical protein HII31_05897 [Pseudocercospora fuligena]
MGGAPKLLAIADIHLSFKSNREEWAKLKVHKDDGLILAGDVGESLEHMQIAFRKAVRRFKTVWWCPGNHELYTSSSPSLKEEERKLRGEAKYRACIKVARHYGVLTPEDDFATWSYTSAEGSQERALVCPIFTLYDYSFRPDDVPREKALDWALEEGIQATDEKLLHPDPYSSRDNWCTRLVSEAEAKLEKASESGLPLIIINHWPLREDLIFIPRVPRFSLWCGTKETHDWHTRFNAKVVVTGHLHVRRTDWIDGVRFEEVSLGYPRQWQDAKDAGNDINTLLREILPGPITPVRGQEPPTQYLRIGIAETPSWALKPQCLG